MKKIKLYQQGDVLIYKVDEEKENKGKNLKITPRGYVLAEGEHTGHAHVIDLPQIDKVLAFMDNEMEIFLKVQEDVIVRHEEHNSVSLPPGNYIIDYVNEVDPFTEEVNKVAD